MKRLNGFRDPHLPVCRSGHIQPKLSSPFTEWVINTMVQQKLVQFLQTELAIPTNAIAIGLRHSAQAPNMLPMVLWQYGLITLEQLDRVFEWMETA